MNQPKKLIKIPKEVLYDILNVYEYGTVENLKHVEKLIKEQRPQANAKEQVDLILKDVGEIRFETHWSHIFEIRNKIKNESKN